MALEVPIFSDLNVTLVFDNNKIKLIKLNKISIF